MRICVLSAAAMCLAAAPVFAQTPKDVTGPLTMTPSMVMCTDLPATSKPVPGMIIKDAHTTDERLASYPTSHVLIARSEGDNFEVGQRFIASRAAHPKDFPRPGEGYGDVRVTGVIRIIAINEWHARAVVDLACDTVQAGDGLEPFVATELPTAAAAMLKPDFDDRGQIIFGVDSRSLIGAGEVASINRGTTHGVVPGARYAIYRDKRSNGLALIYLGEAVVMSVAEDTAKVAITKAVDGIESGDTVVPRRLPQ